MSYHLYRKKTVKAGIVKIAKSQIDKAIEEIDDEELDRHEVVHQVRKRCKKLRGLIRLIRPIFPEYKTENVFFRDAAGELSSVRDAQSVIECFDNLAEYYQDRTDSLSFEPICRQLIERRTEVADDAVELEEKLKKFRARMIEARGCVKKWKISKEGFDAIADGFMKTYKRGRKAFPRAYEKPSTENFHEWRGELQHQAQLLGERLYAEKKKHIAKRFDSYWMSWRR